MAVLRGVHLQAIGLSPSETSLILLSGPICGAVFQPAFGSWSDRCFSRWGRRKPFIVSGVIALILSILCLACVDIVPQATLRRSHNEQPPPGRLLVALSAVLTFLVFVAIQAVHVGLRALITDDCTPAQQSEANTWAGRHSSFGAAFSFLTAYLDLWHGVRGLDKTVFSRASIPTALYLSITIAVTCCFTEERLVTDTVQEEKRQLGNWRIIRTIFFGTSSQIRTIYMVQFLSWLGMFPFLYYTVTYVNSLEKSTLNTNQEKVNTGSPHHSMGTLTPVVYSIISMVAAMGLPRSSLTNSSASRHWIANFCTARGLWATSQLCFTTAMMGTFFVSSALGTVILFGFVGITFGINAIVPFYLLGEELSRPSSTHWTEIVWSQSQGLIYGLNNLAICLPQILIICLMGIMWRQQPGGQGQGHGGEGIAARDVVWFLRFGGLATLVATYFVSRLEKRGQDEDGAEYVEIPLEAEA
ncbi:general alpha-glucoside permease [Apiospora sp. TS-2023a]